LSYKQAKTKIIDISEEDVGRLKTFSIDFPLTGKPELSIKLWYKMKTAKHHIIKIEWNKHVDVVQDCSMKVYMIVSNYWHVYLWIGMEDFVKLKQCLLICLARNIPIYFEGVIGSEIESKRSFYVFNSFKLDPIKYCPLIKCNIVYTTITSKTTNQMVVTNRQKSS